MGFKTFVAGEVLTASDVNTYLMKQVVIVCTSGTRPSSPNEGMTIYETDTDKVMIYDGSGWVEALKLNQPRVRVQRNTTQSISTGSATAISFNTELHDLGGGMWVIGSPTRLTAPIAGLYLCGAAAEFAANATGNRQVQIMVNGSENHRITIPSVGSGLATRVMAASLVSLAASDFIEFNVFQDSGGSLNLTNGGNMPYGWAVRVGHNT